MLLHRRPITVSDFHCKQWRSIKALCVASLVAAWTWIFFSQNSECSIWFVPYQYCTQGKLEQLLQLYSSKIFQFNFKQHFFLQCYVQYDDHDVWFFTWNKFYCRSAHMHGYRCDRYFDFQSWNKHVKKKNNQHAKNSPSMIFLCDVRAVLELIPNLSGLTFILLQVAYWNNDRGAA